ncbi:MAG: PHP domain-containing protein [Erysipelotrichaceae bacterium]|nr:PHP domain-containing protein [Erysipelotrichaceae bacterium]
MNNVDLHMHSIYSDDGEYSVFELIDMAKAKGMRLMAITDHDIAEANEDAITYAKQVGIDYLPGIEISCRHDGVDLHILGYDIDHRNPIWQQRYKALMADYQIGIVKVVALLNDYLKVDIDIDRLRAEAGDKPVTGETICAYLLEDESNIENPLLRPYFKGGDRSDMPLVNFYWDYMAQGKIAYVDGNFITSLEDALAMIKESNGFAVLAHPGQNLAGKEEMLADIIDAGVIGIEVYTSYHDETQIAYYLKKAEQFGCLITGGSDYHGAIKPNIVIGEHHGQIEYDSFVKELKKRGLR